MNLGLFSYLLNSKIFMGVLLWIKRLWFLWLPIVLGDLFLNAWSCQARLNFLRNMQWVLLEIRIPRGVLKGPHAVEIILNSLYLKPSSDPWWKWKRLKNFFKGTIVDWYSLEIASINGAVRFFVRAPKPARNFVQSQIYAQFPGAEILEAEDYTYLADFGNLNEWDIWGSELKLVKEDAYPIRTYIDFGLHQIIDEKAEAQKINPLVSFLEFLGSLKQGEQAWMQIVVRGVGSEWIDSGKKLIDEIMGRNKKTSAGETPEKKVLTKGEQEVVAAMERNMAKIAFKTGIRMMYIARRDIFNKVNGGALIGLMNQYSTQNLNGFKGGKSVSAKFLFKKRREELKKKGMLNNYRKRYFLDYPCARETFVFNTEELATIYHFPGRVAETPTFERIEAKRGTPPINLPI
ncbi:hypothetical protein KKB69_00045 [Patescibacteria group bacterium]|nr:hypothetical protein [Patescibacteria group bacterium]